MSSLTEAFFADADHFRVLFEQSPVGVVTVGNDYLIRDCNVAFASFVGSTRERLHRFDVRKIKDKRIAPSIARAVENGETTTYRGPYDATTADAHVVIDMKCMPLRDANGVQQGILSVWSDASESAKIESDLRHQLAVVERQSATIRELGTPILKIWDRVVCMPIIGAVDTSRAAEMTETLLQAIIAERARFAVVDLTGVDALDTGTAQHLMQLFRSVALIGSEAVLCGIRPAVAQTVTMLDVDMSGVHTVRSMYEALRYCLRARADQG